MESALQASPWTHFTTPKQNLKRKEKNNFFVIAVFNLCYANFFILWLIL
jgi:hypothetical protein